jgi:hypothetical protein
MMAADTHAQKPWHHCLLSSIDGFQPMHRLLHMVQSLVLSWLLNMLLHTLLHKQLTWPIPFIKQAVGLLHK